MRKMFSFRNITPSDTHMSSSSSPPPPPPPPPVGEDNDLHVHDDNSNNLAVDEGEDEEEEEERPTKRVKPLPPTPTSRRTNNDNGISNNNEDNNEDNNDNTTCNTNNNDSSVLLLLREIVQPHILAAAAAADGGGAHTHVVTATTASTPSVTTTTNNNNDDNNDDNNNNNNNHNNTANNHDFGHSYPFPHVILPQVFQEDFLQTVITEVKEQFKVHFKESDLFRVYQSMDVANLTDNNSQSNNQNQQQQQQRHSKSTTRPKTRGRKKSSNNSNDDDDDDVHNKDPARKQNKENDGNDDDDDDIKKYEEEMKDGDYEEEEKDTATTKKEEKIGACGGGCWSVPAVRQMRDLLYSAAWRRRVEQWCHLPPHTLLDRVDGAFNCHTTGCHLLCHDDVIGTRKISFILYLTDPNWTADEGGALELYNRQEDEEEEAESCPNEKEDPDKKETNPIVPSRRRRAAATAVPQSIPCTVILPTFNQMVLFGVEPGVSFHAVQEVWGNRPRLSFQGWYHAAQEPHRVEFSTRHQLKQKIQHIMQPQKQKIKDSTDRNNIRSNNKNHDRAGDDDENAPMDDDAFPVPFTPLVYPATTTTAVEARREGEGDDDDHHHKEDSSFLFSEQEREYLTRYINETYLTHAALEDIRHQFEQDSSVQLRHFLNDFWIQQLNRARAQQEDVENNNNKFVWPQQQQQQQTLLTPQQQDWLEQYYQQGVSKEWKLIGPPHKQRFLEYSHEDQQQETNVVVTEGTGESSTVALSSSLSCGALLHHLQQNLLCSIPFSKFLALVTSLGLPMGYRGRIRRFRKGLDYTVAHYGILTSESVLDATLCFVATTTTNNNDNDKNTAISKNDARQGVAPDAIKREKPPDDDDEDSTNDDLIWESGDCGGFECYIAAEDEEDEDGDKVVAADEYHDPRGEDEEDDDNRTSTELLSVSPSNNTLSLVYRDPGTLRFIKYVGSSAPSSRWDIAMVYQVPKDEEEDGDDTNSDEELGVREMGKTCRNGG